MARRDKTGSGPVTIKKYANRRLYNTSTSSYVTLDHLSEMVREDIDFVVFDAKSGEDITRSVLTQIIFEAEGKGQNVLPVNFLRQLISFYGDSLQGLLPSYLDMSMDAFAQNQDEMRTRFSGPLGTPLKHFEEATKRNMALFDQAMSMFNPFMASTDPTSMGKTPPTAKAPAKGSSAEPSETSESTGTESPLSGGDIEQMKGQLDAMQRQLEKLMKPKG
ncbi:MAG: polyhydroxyalkanoate synthesis repressor PhaR [Minwuia sp.]|nr:polyhydroxyalkanoate synthesis repressor PhaR [Minwuia sp.]